MLMKKSRKSLSCLAMVWATGVLHACPTNTGSPGGETPILVGENSGGSSCEETEVELDPIAPTSLGFTAQSVLDLVVGEHVASLAWLDADVDYGPESGRSEITLAVTLRGAPVLVDREPRPAGSANGAEGGPTLLLPEIYSPCHDSIRFGVSIAVTTAGGALEEVVETSMEANASDFVRGGFALDLASIDGGFEAALELPSNFEIVRAWLVADLGFSAFGKVGALRIDHELRSLDGQAVGLGGTGEIAHFPAEDYCGPAAVSVAADQRVRGLSMAQALDALNAMSPSQVRYSSGEVSELTLAFTSAEPRVCARFDAALSGASPAGNMALEFPGLVELSSADGRVQGDAALQISLSNQDGIVQTLAQGSNDAQPAGAPGLAVQFGIQDDIDFSGYDGAMVRVLSSVADGTSGGSLRVYGLDVADCVTNPPPIDPAAMRYPGCRGTDQVPLWGAFWGDQIEPDE
jgi:hypothetical protein